MDWSRAWKLVGDIEPGISLLASGIAGVSFLWFRLKRFRRWIGDKLRRGPAKARPSDLKLDERTYAWPIRERLAVAPDVLAHYVRANGRVPHVSSRPRRLLVRLRNRIRLAWLSANAAPKSAFTVASWHYEPGAEMGDDCAPYVGGFTLHVRLHDRENRRHLRRSATAIGKADGWRRLVVIATPGDLTDDKKLMNDESWVRCLVVRAYGTKLPKSCPGEVVLRAADPLQIGKGSAYRCRRDEVPRGAMWLIAAVSNHRAPSKRWGHLEERYEQAQVAPAGPGAEEPAEFETSPTLGGVLWRSRLLVCVRWMFFGPGMFGLARLLDPAPGGLVSSGETGEPFLEMFLDIWGWAWTVYFSAYIVLAAAALAHLIFETLIAATWRIRERKAGGAKWNGGTRECLAARESVRRGVKLASTPI